MVFDKEYNHKVETYDEIETATFELEEDTLSTKLYAKWEEIKNEE